MKILLFGDYSSVHLNLKEGLEKLGHRVTLVGTGDGFKGIKADINLKSFKFKLLNKLFFRIKAIFLLYIFRNYDVVQLISPYILKVKLFPTNFYYDFLKNNNKKFFMLAAGSDAYYWRYGPKKLKYGPFKDVLKYDLKSDNFNYYQSKKSFEFNQKISMKVNGVIPMLPDYQICYEPHSNLLPLIPLPININKIKYKKNKINNKIIIFHGLNRYGFKGTRYIEEAFELLRKKYPDDLELIIKGRMPIKDYLNIMSQSNIVIDQTSTYSLGVNGVYGLALGKVVMGGAEPESLLRLGVEKSPVINIKPKASYIVMKIEEILKNRNLIEEIGEESRLFAEENHNYLTISMKFLRIWENH